MATLAEILARKAGAPPAPAPAGGTVIRKEDEQGKLAAQIKLTLDATAPKTPPPLPHAEDRELGATFKGERIPMDQPAEGSPDADWEWFDSLHSFECDLGIIIDPRQDCAWIALKANPTQAPLLLHRLPLFNRALAGNPF